MNNPGDDGSRETNPAGAPPGAPDAGRPRKPRIEVLQPGPTAAPQPDPAQDGHNAGFRGPAGGAPAASPGRPSRIFTNQPQQVGAPREPRRSGRSGSPTTLLLLLAAIVIAGCLLYTYFSSKADGDSSPRRTKSSSADAEPPRDLEDGADAATDRDSGEPSTAAASTEDGAVPEPEPGPVASYPSRSAAPRAAAPDARPGPVADEAEEAPTPAPAPAGDDAAANTVRAFYSALSAGDGTSAAQLVIPAKRRNGPLSASALTRYYSSFRRPLRVQRVTPVDADTVRVAYDYVLPDGRACPGQAAVEVVRRDGRTLVSSIRTRGRC